MVPRLGGKYNLEIETTSKPNAEYRTEEYTRLGWPAAPAIMVGDELIVQGCDVDEGKLEAAICRHLRLPEPARQKKGNLFNRLFDK